ncbi:hypothetical protein CVU37_09440 [candidate division BRC1 bacterium HGW-BRC1-1]|jgi:hypothetical protein|nr:MAG: hypothetical protein CVU37_09440 [candidate division BRC1 bacterium HGW-BRC1-1]
MKLLSLQKWAVPMIVVCTLLSIFVLAYYYLIAPMLYKDPAYPTPVCWMVVFAMYGLSFWLSQYTAVKVGWLAHAPFYFVILFHYMK